MRKSKKEFFMERRGFSSMDEETRRENASKGGRSRAPHRDYDDRSYRRDDNDYRRSEPRGRSGGSRRGFAAMDEETQRAIARKGGETVARERGPEFYERIGRKGGQTTAREYGPEFY